MNFNIPVEKLPKTSKIFEKLKIALADLLDKESKKILSDIRQSMRGPKSGKIHKTRFGYRQSSAPGQSPGVVSGKLIGSLRARKSNEGLRVRISAEVRYGKLLEYGTPGGQLLPRPFMGPAKAAARTVTIRDARGVISAQIKARVT